MSSMMLHVLRNTQATFQDNFMKKLSNAAEAEMKKTVAYKNASICKLSGLQRCNLHFLLL